MRFDGPNGRRNFLLAVIFGFLAVSILIFGIIAFIVGLTSPSPTPTTDSQASSEQADQQRSGSSGGSDSSDGNDGANVSPGESDDSNTVSATSIKLSSDSITVAVGEKATISATLEPKNTTDKITWTSSKNDIATVTAEGIITGIKAGTACVTAEVNSNVVATALVTVTQSDQTAPQQPSQVIINPTEIKLDKTSENVKIGTTVKLKATIIPNNASNTSITWTSSDNNIATVSDGVVTGKKIGTTTITAKTYNGKVATAKIMVISDASAIVPVTSIKVSPTSTSIKVGSTVTISASITPENATEKQISWASSDNDIATVSSGGVVMGKKVGTVTITAKTASGRIATATVKITADTSNTIPATGIKLSAKSATIKVGGTYRLTALVEPTNATNRVIDWSSSDTNIAAVTGGIVTGKKAGIVTITAKTHNGKTATAKITVYDRP